MIKEERETAHVYYANSRLRVAIIGEKEEIKWSRHSPKTSKTIAQFKISKEGMPCREGDGGEVAGCLQGHSMEVLCVRTMFETENLCKANTTAWHLTALG